MRPVPKITRLSIRLESEETQAMGTKSKSYVLFVGEIVLLVSGLLVLLLAISQVVTKPAWLEVDDFVEYWAAGWLNLTGGNPYAPLQLAPLQLQTGRTFGVPLMMWNPPWMLTFVMPFAIPNYVIGRALWLLVNFGIVFWATEQLQRLYHVAPEQRWLSYLVGISFGPALQTLKTGQSGILLLLGVVGFLSGLVRRKYWLAGILATFLVIKPHVLYLVLLAMLVWSVRYREWRILVGLGATLLLAALLPWLLNPDIWQQYFYATAHYPPVDWATPTCGGLLRFLFGHEQFWLQFVPSALGLLWFFFYWRRYGAEWDWLERLPLLALVSVMTAAYGWSSDQSVTLVAVLPVVVSLTQRPWTIAKGLLLFAYIIITLLVLGLTVEMFWMWWLAPAYLGWYLLSKRVLSPEMSSPDA